MTSRSGAQILRIGLPIQLTAEISSAIVLAVKPLQIGNSNEDGGQTTSIPVCAHQIFSEQQNKGIGEPLNSSCLRPNVNSYGGTPKCRWISVKLVIGNWQLVN